MDELNSVEIESIKGLLERLGSKGFSVLGVMTQRSKKCIRIVSTLTDDSVVELVIVMCSSSNISNLEVYGEVSDLIGVIKRSDLIKDVTSMSFKTKINPHQGRILSETVSNLSVLYLNLR